MGILASQGRNFSLSFWLFGSLLFLVSCQKSVAQAPNRYTSEDSSIISQEELEFQQCLNQIEADERKVTANQNDFYRQVDPSENGIRLGQSSIFKRGKRGKSAVLLLHGILVYPASQQLLIDELNNAGMTVLAPLIKGFGSSVKVANSSTIEGWQKTVDTHYLILSRCFSEISLVGFSLGGALVTDFVLHRYPTFEYAAKINSMVLLSPAIEPAEKFVWLKAHVTLPFTDEVPFWLISKLKNDPDISEMMKRPDLYNQKFPVQVGLNLMRLSKILRNSTVQRFDQHEMPVSLDYSKMDTATNWDRTREFLTDKFFDVRIFSYSEEQNVPHTLGLSHHSPLGDKIRKGLTRFIEWYAQDPEHRERLY